MTTVYTIGYEGTDIKRFVATLVAAKVEVLADVRAVAISRKKGFSKNRLREELAIAGIRYEHFVDLGDPKPGREAARAGKMSVFKKIYTGHLETNKAQDALEALQKIVRTSATCMMCFERDPQDCHRNIIAGKLESCGISTFHLFGDSPARYANNDRFLPGRDSHQSSAARQ